MLLLGTPAMGPVSVLPCLLPRLQETPGLSLLHLPRRMQGTQLSIPLLACPFSFFWSRSISSLFFFFFIEFVTMLLLFYILAFCLQGMWDLNSLTRD